MDEILKYIKTKHAVSSGIIYCLSRFVITFFYYGFVIIDKKLFVAPDFLTDQFFFLKKLLVFFQISNYVSVNLNRLCNVMQKDGCVGRDLLKPQTIASVIRAKHH